MLKRLSIVFLLGFSSGLPLALVGSTLQAWFASTGLPIVATTMLSLLGLPYLYRMLWGPLLDRCSILALGKRRGWILLMQVSLLLGFNLLAWFSPATEPRLMAVLAFFLACFSATQDAAIDAHRIEYLPRSEHGLGASLAICGYRFALMLSGGLALILASYYGFALTYRLMGGLMCIGIFATLISKEPFHANSQSLSLGRSFTMPLLELAKRPQMVWFIFFIVFYAWGEAFTATTSSVVIPFLIQGLGFSLDTIGYINKLLGIAAILIGGIIAGFVLLRCALFKALLAFGLFQAASNLLFIALAFMGKNTFMLAMAVLFDNCAAGMTSTALVVFFMQMVNKEHTATQFSLFVAVSTLPRIFSGPLTALLEPWLGWVGLYQFASLLALGFIPFLLKIRPHFENIKGYFLEEAA